MSATDANTHELEHPQKAISSPEEEGLYKHAFWLYGVLVGLSITEVLKGIVPHVVNPPANPPIGRWPDFVRLIVFITVIIRFYLGSAVFFDAGYIRKTKVKYPKKSYGVDFFFGIIHFIVFVAWAISIDVHSRPLRLFPLILCIILIYDVAWYLACRTYDTRRLIKMWTGINVVTLILGGLTYVVARYVIGCGLFLSESLAFLWVLLFSAIDLAEIITNKKYFSRWLKNFLEDES